MKPKNTVCLWFDKDAHAAARFYAATFPNSEVTAVRKAPGDYPGGKAGDELTVEFTVLGIPCLGINGGPAFPHTEAFSFLVEAPVFERRVREAADRVATATAIRAPLVIRAGGVLHATENRPTPSRPRR